MFVPLAKPGKSTVDKSQTLSQCYEDKEKRTPGTSGKMVPGVLFCIALYGILLKQRQFSLNLTEIEKLSIKLKNLSAP